jgi:hypothetical protein
MSVVTAKYVQTRFALLVPISVTRLTGLSEKFPRMHGELYVTPTKDENE